MSRLSRDGFVVLPAMLDEESVRRVGALVDETLTEQRPGGCERTNNVLVPLRWDDPLVDNLLSRPSLIRALRLATAASDLRWISGYISLRPPRTGGLPWHQDWWCWDHPITFRTAAPQVAMLCYLDTVESENAALRVLPGSHRHSTPLHDALAGLDPRSGDAGDTIDDGALTISVQPGDVVVLDYRVLHTTTPNATDARRDCVLLSFTPSWRELPEDVRSHLISHLPLPRHDERVRPWYRHSGLLPTFDGPRNDLELNRYPPRDFALSSDRATEMNRPGRHSVRISSDSLGRSPDG